MHINSDVAILSGKVLLVPYGRHHVVKYHQWMQDPELRTATASEELSIEEEYAMQESWRRDHDKLTFILCEPPTETSRDLQSITANDYDHDKTMIGDINMFLSSREFELEETNDSVADTVKLVGEIEIMVAEKRCRGTGIGSAALKAFMRYIMLKRDEILQEYLGPEPSFDAARLVYLRAKIDQHNGPSIRLFRAHGFKQVSPDPNYFGEIELRWMGQLPVDDTRYIAYTSPEQPASGLG